MSAFLEIHAKYAERIAHLPFADLDKIRDKANPIIMELLRECGESPEALRGAVHGMHHLVLIAAAKAETEVVIQGAFELFLTYFGLMSALHETPAYQALFLLEESRAHLA